jgi:hypothetical protein
MADALNGSLGLGYAFVATLMDLIAAILSRRCPECLKRLSRPERNFQRREEAGREARFASR